MPAGEIGTAYLRVAGDFTQLNAQAVGLMSASKWKSMGKVAGGALAAGFVVAGGAKIAYDLGKSFDDAFDSIRVKTGATGKELKGLQKTFKNVFGSLPTDMDTAAKAVAGLNQRLDLTGKPLERLSKQFVALSEITGEDIEGNVSSISRAFGDWEVKTREQADTLDYFFRAAQASGTQVTELTDLIVQFGAPLRRFGFSVEDATSMFALFEKSGVNIQTMIPGLKLALSDFLERGIDPEKGLLKTFKGIEDGTISASDAIDIFGKRAGADMVEAIEQGRFKFEDFTETIQRGNETILGTEKRTRDAEEWLQKLGNTIKNFVEPVVTDFYNAIGNLAEGLVKFLRSEDFKSFAADVETAFRSLAPVFNFVGDAAGRALKGIADSLRGLAQFVRGIAEVIGGVLTLKFGKAWDGIKNIFAGGAKVIMGTLRATTAPLRELASRIGHALSGPFKAAWEFIKGVFEGGRDRIRAVMGGIGRGITNVMKGIRGAFKGVADVVKTVVRFIVNAVNKAVGALGSLKDKVDAVIPDVSVPDITPWSGLAPWQKGGLAAVVPGHSTGDKHVLAVDGRPVGKVESREGVFIGNRNMMSALGEWNSKVPRFASGGIVGLGRQLQQQGYLVGEHPAFGGVAPVHTAGSYHYKGMALDVNWPSVAAEPAKLTSLYNRLKGMSGVVELLWQVADHFDHLHVAMSGAGGPLGAIGGSAANIPRLKVSGKGVLAGVAQGAADKVRTAANAYLAKLGPTEGAEPGISADGAVQKVFASVAKKLSSSKTATLALGMAGFAESGMRDLAYGDSSSQGALQLLASTASGMGINPHDEGAIASAFLLRGFYGRGGANSLAARGLPAHLVAQNVQGSAFSSGSNYLAQRANAENWMRAFGLQRGGMPPFAGSFAAGGTVPGPVGAPRTAIVHGGEEIGYQRKVEVHLHGPGMDAMVDEMYAVIDGETAEIAEFTLREGGRNVSRSRQLAGRAGR